MKKLANTVDIGATSIIEKGELKLRDKEILDEVKQLEKKYKKKLKRIDILHGYIMTTHPEDYKDMKLEG